MKPLFAASFMLSALLPLSGGSAGAADSPVNVTHSMQSTFVTLN